MHWIDASKRAGAAFALLGLALAAAQGAECRWVGRLEAPGLEVPVVVDLSSPVVAQGLVVCGSGDGMGFIGSGDGRFHALDLATAAERWRFSTGQSWVGGSPAVAGARVVFATSDSSLVHIVGDVVYIGSADGRLYALE